MKSKILSPLNSNHFLGSKSLLADQKISVFKTFITIFRFLRPKILSFCGLAISTISFYATQRPRFYISRRFFNHKKFFRNTIFTIFGTLLEYIKIYQACNFHANRTKRKSLTAVFYSRIFPRFFVNSAVN